MYENLSIVYDKLMDVDYDAYKNIISQELGDRKDLLVLDLGCGSGTMLPTLTKYGQVFAVDNSEQMLALASRKVPECNYFAMDLLEISNLSYEFDFVLSAFDVFNYLEDFEDFNEGLKGVYDSLKVGGKFVESPVTESYEVYDANGDYKRYSNRTLTTLVSGGTYRIENDILVFASGSRYKLEINGNTMVYTSSDGSKRNTFTKL